MHTDSLPATGHFLLALPARICHNKPQWNAMRICFDKGQPRPQPGRLVVVSQKGRIRLRNVKWVGLTPVFLW
jgi:hypothetical protein